MTQLRAALAALEGWYAGSAPHLLERLLPPSDRPGVPLLTDAQDDPSAASVRTLYQWRGGGGGPDAPFFLAPDFGFIPETHAADTRGWMREFAASQDNWPDGYWETTWLPVGSSWCGDYLVVAPDRGGVVAPFYQGDGLRRDMVLPSLTHLIEEHLRCLSTGGALWGRRLDPATGQWD